MRATLSAIALFFVMPAYAQPDIVVENKPCCEAQRSTKPDAGEAALLATLSDRAFRDRGALWLKLEGNRSMRMVDCVVFACPSADYAYYQLEAWWPTHRYYVVNVGLYKGQMAYLVRATDGRLSRLFTTPVLSPSGRYAIAWDGSPAYGQGLQLVDMSSDPPLITKIETMPACPGIKQQYSLRPKAVWIDEEHVTFEGRPYFDNDDPNAKQMLRIVDGKLEWQC